MLAMGVIGVMLVAGSGGEGVSALVDSTGEIRIESTQAPPGTPTPAPVLTSTSTFEATPSPVSEQTAGVTSELPLEQGFPTTEQVPQHLVTPKDNYDNSRPFQTIIKPHFLAQSTTLISTAITRLPITFAIWTMWIPTPPPAPTIIAVSGLLRCALSRT